MNNFALMLAFVFLFNPIINVFDILPDFIGWLLIFSAVKRARFISVQMENASYSLIKMIWLSFASFICVFLSPHLDGTMLLTIIFAVNVMKLIWGIPAFKYVFAGISELSQLYDGKSIFTPLGRSNKEGISVVERFTYIFLVSSCVLNTLPEFSELSAQSSKIISEGQRTLLSFKPLFYVAAFVISLIIGIVWLSLILPFFGRIYREKDFAARVKEAYKEKVIDTGKHRAMTVMSALLLAIVSGLFLICVMFNDMNIVPRFVMPLFILCASLMLDKCGYSTKPLTAVSGLTTVISATSYIMRWHFVTEYSYDSIRRSFEAYNFYTLTLGMLLAELVLLVVMQILWTKILVKISVLDAGREVLSVNAEKTNEINAADKKRNKKRAIISLILFVISCTLNVSSFLICHEMPASWTLVLSISIVWFVYTYSFYSNLRSGIERKYF